MKKPAPDNLADCVSVNRFPITLLDETHGVTAWHSRWKGRATWRNGAGANVKELVRVGRTDICVVTLDRPVKAPTAKIAGPGRGWFRDRNGVLLPAMTDADRGRAEWQRCGLDNGDSASPHIRVLKSGIAIDALATSYTYGPALAAYKLQIAKAKR